MIAQYSNQMLKKNKNIEMTWRHSIGYLVMNKPPKTKPRAMAPQTVH